MTDGYLLIFPSVSLASISHSRPGGGATRPREKSTRMCSCGRIGPVNCDTSTPPSTVLYRAVPSLYHCSTRMRIITDRAAAYIRSLQIQPPCAMVEVLRLQTALAVAVLLVITTGAGDAVQTFSPTSTVSYLQVSSDVEVYIIAAK